MRHEIKVEDSEVMVTLEMTVGELDEIGRGIYTVPIGRFKDKLNAARAVVGLLAAARDAHQAETPTT